MQGQERLTSEVCHVVFSKLAYLASSGQDDALKAAGFNERQIAQLGNASYREFDKWLTQRKHKVDIQVVLKGLFPDELEIPKEWREMIVHGANNKMMKHYFGARTDDCRRCRDELTVLKHYRGRVIGHKKHSDVCKALAEVMSDEAVEDFRDLPFEGLLNVAKTYQVSLGALWNELESWEKQNEQKNSKA
ncbi:TPA: STY4526/YPO1902 family pathogenicity island replication protein [Vibrio parahaemolyticus]